MFDPYHKWLGIPADQRPPTLYQLLGISPTEQDKEVIREAAIRQTNHLRAYQAGPNAETCAKLLNEIAQAQIVLSDPAKRKDYDAKLARTAKKPAAPASGPPSGVAGKTAPTGPRTSTGKPKARPSKKSARGVVLLALLVLLGGGAAVALWKFRASLFGSNNGVAVTSLPVRETAPATTRPADTQPGEIRQTTPVPETKPILETRPLPPETRPQPKITPDDKVGTVRAEGAASDEPKGERKPPLAKGERPGEAHPAGQRTVAKHPLPPPDAQAKNEKLLKDVFKNDYAKLKTAADRQALAAKLLEQGLAEKTDLTSRYVLLQESSNLAAQGGDALTVVKAIDELAKDFAIAALEKKAGALEGLAKAVLPAQATKGQVDTALQVADEAVAADQYDLALRLLKETEALAKKVKAGPVKLVQERITEVDRLHKDHQQYLKALAVLKANPADAEANLAVGRFQAVNKGSWELALPHLAACGVAGLQELAREDLAFPADAAKRAALGDSWWDLPADSTVAKRRYQERAVYWYESAVAGLTGLAKTKVEQRLAGVARPSTPATTLIFKDLKDLKEIAEPISAEFWSIKDGTLTAGKDSFLWFKPSLGEPFWLRLAFTSGGTHQALAFGPGAVLEAAECWLIELTPDNRLKLRLHKGPGLGPKGWSHPLPPGRHVLTAHGTAEELRVYIDGQEALVYRMEPEAPQPLKLGLYTATGETNIEGLSFGSGKAATRITPSVKVDPNAVVVLFDEDSKFIELLTTQGEGGKGNLVAETKDTFSGTLACRLGPKGGQQMANIPTWKFIVAEKPKPGEYRYIRFAWKVAQGNAIAFALANRGQWGMFYSVNYSANLPGSKTVAVGNVAPTTGWVVVTRDLFQDFGQVEITGISLMPLTGSVGLFDAIYLGRTMADLDVAFPVKRR